VQALSSVAVDVESNVPIMVVAEEQFERDWLLPRLLLLNGCGAFALNVASFNANKVCCVGPSHVTPCHVTPCHVTPCHGMSVRHMPRHAKSHNVA
jgi:hypothetical protein